MRVAPLTSFTPLALAALALADGCAGDRKETATADSATADTGAAVAAATPTARPAGTVKDLKNPESVRWDPELRVWFVSNINGESEAKDNNGFISRLKADGSVDSLQFIAGGRNKVTLNAPKGMAI